MNAAHALPYANLYFIILPHKDFSYHQRTDFVEMVTIFLFCMRMVLVFGDCLVFESRNYDDHRIAMILHDIAYLQTKTRSETKFN